MIGEMAVWDGNSGWTHNSINEPIITPSHGNMINPNIRRSINWNPISISLRAVPIMIHRVSNESTTTFLNMMNMEPVDDDVLHKLHRDLTTVADVNIGAARIYGLVISHQKLTAESYVHVTRKRDP